MQSIFPAPLSVPRLNSLLHRLQKASAAKNETSCLDQLMNFLDDPPPGVTDRWKAGAEMCAGWGIITSGAATWRLYCGYVDEWRTMTALNKKPSRMRRKMAELAAMRATELLANPDTSAATLLSLARLDLRRRAMELARRKSGDIHRKTTPSPPSA